jgi:patatin-like phospholipase/acyl hydrolase
MTENEPPKLCGILSLDGGGAKGFYTLGVLKGIEGTLGAPLHEHFDLVYGTSTGSIIAALICLVTRWMKSTPFIVDIANCTPLDKSQRLHSAGSDSAEHAAKLHRDEIQSFPSR